MSEGFDCCGAPLASCDLMGAAGIWIQAVCTTASILRRAEPLSAYAYSANGAAEDKKDLVGRIGDGGDRVRGKNGERCLLAQALVLQSLARQRAPDEQILDVLDCDCHVQRCCHAVGISERRAWEPPKAAEMTEFHELFVAPFGPWPPSR